MAANAAEETSTSWIQRLVLIGLTRSEPTMAALAANESWALAENNRNGSAINSSNAARQIALSPWRGRPLAKAPTSRTSMSHARRTGTPAPASSAYTPAATSAIRSAGRRTSVRAASGVHHPSIRRLAA